MRSSVSCHPPELLPVSPPWRRRAGPKFLALSIPPQQFLAPTLKLPAPILPANSLPAHQHARDALTQATERWKWPPEWKWGRGWQSNHVASQEARDPMMVTSSLENQFRSHEKGANPSIRAALPMSPTSHHHTEKHVSSALTFGVKLPTYKNWSKPHVAHPGDEQSELIVGGVIWVLGDPGRGILEAWSWSPLGFLPLWLSYCWLGLGPFSVMT